MRVVDDAAAIREVAALSASDSADAALVRRLGYTFRNPLLLETALRHRSARVPKIGDNERLEFLGDALIGLVIGEALYRHEPPIVESKLSVMRSRLVCRETLAEVARELGVDTCLRLGKGERRAGVVNRDSVQADALEALFGAVYLDAGFATVQALVLKLFAGRLQQVVATGGDRDAKSRLQEWLQARGLALPVYVMVARSGRDPEFTYEIACRVAARGAERVAVHRDVRQAEQKAAEAMLQLLEKERLEEDRLEEAQ